MGMRKKWSRLITVDGTQYRYHVAPDRDGLALSICIQQVEPEGQRLLTGFPKPMNMVQVGPGHWWGQPIPHAVTPIVIRRLIEAALDRGWQPEKVVLPPFGMKAWEVVPELPPPVKEEAASGHGVR